MPLSNVKVRPIGKVPPFRRVAIGTWTDPGDPQIYGTLDLDLTEAYRWRDGLPESAPKVTVTHMIARAIGVAMHKYPDLNGFIRFRRIYLRQQVDLFFQVAVPHPSGRTDLTGVRIEDAAHKGVTDIAADMAAQVERVRTKGDTDIQKTAKLLAGIPGFVMGLVLSLVAWISYTLNLRFPGIPSDQFGGCMITNIGSIGMDVAYAPLVPYSRVPVIRCVGMAKDRPVVVDGRVEVHPVVTINATIDHRFCDGAMVAKLVRVIRSAFAKPEDFFGSGIVE